MRDIPNKVDNVDTLNAAEFNSFYKGSKNLIRMFFGSLTEVDQEQLAKAAMMFAQVAGEYNITSSGTPAFQFTTRTYGDAQAPEPTDYYQGMVLNFFPNYNAINGDTVSVKIGSLAAKNVYLSDKTTAVPHSHIRTDLSLQLKFDVVLDGFYIVSDGGAVTAEALNLPGSDLDNATITGLYRSVSGDANKPISAGDDGLVFHLDMSDGSADQKSQLYFDTVNNTFSFRIKGAGAWGLWVTPVVDGGDYTPRAGVSDSDNSIRHPGGPVTGFSFTGTKNISWNTGSINPYSAMKSSSISDASFFEYEHSYLKLKATNKPSLLYPYIDMEPPTLISNASYTCFDYGYDTIGSVAGSHNTRAGAHRIRDAFNVIQYLNGLGHWFNNECLYFDTDSGRATSVAQTYYTNSSAGIFDVDDIVREDVFSVGESASLTNLRNRDASGFASATTSNVNVYDSCNIIKTQNVYRFFRDASQVGSIQTTLTGTNYNVTSDSRAKENIEEIEEESFGDNVLKIPNKRYKFKGTDCIKEDMVAEDIYEFCPEATTGTPGETDGDGNPILMQVDYSKMVPRLLALCKNQEKRINKLNKRLKKLEGKK